MDKRLGSFMRYSLLLMAVIGAIAILLSTIYRFFTINVYNKILSVLIFLSIVIITIVALSMIAIFTVVKRRSVKSVLIVPVRLGLKIVMPFALFATNILKRDKDMIRSLFIDINNLYVESGNIRKSPDKILLLLPHCLQNSECRHKVTGNIYNCKKCGRCTIGTILEIVEKTGIKAIIVTGGTAARNTIAAEKPEIVLSVACERDLAIGISDVNQIPVLGVLNRRPNGPCVNTTVDVELLRQKLDSILIKEEKLCEKV